MANSNLEILITKAPLPISQPPRAEPAGAVVEFWGIVRPIEDAREISGIDYQAHEAMAQHQLELIASEAEGEFHCRRIILQHRIGFVAAGEPSLFLQVAARHRQPAFQASQWIVDQLKERVPIWKRPVFVSDQGAAAARSSETVLSTSE